MKPAAPSLLALSLAAACLSGGPARSARAGDPPCRVELTVALDASPVTLESYGPAPGGHVAPGRLAARLRNVGDRTVRLVEPGDGSDVGWRTPVVRWEVERADGTAVDPPPIGRCGNMNPIEAREGFALGPGEERRLGPWIPLLRLPGPGAYTVRLTYENDPDHPSPKGGDGWRGSAAGAMIRESTACRVESAPLRVVVVAGPAAG